MVQIGPELTEMLVLRLLGKSHSCDVIAHATSRAWEINVPQKKHCRRSDELGQSTFHVICLWVGVLKDHVSLCVHGVIILLVW